MDPDELTRLSITAEEAQQAATAAIRARDRAIVTAAEEGMPQPVIIEATGLSRDRIRIIERAGGVPERKRGRPRKDSR